MCKTEVFDALKYRVEVDAHGTRRYYNSARQLHRENGPAVVRSNGTKIWLRNGKLHREDGPAIENSSGLGEWWLNGVELSKFEFEQAVGTHND